MINHKSFCYNISGDKMKIVIASDIHGNLEYAKKLYEFCEKKDPDKIILLGDLLNNYYHSDYFEIDEIVSLMNRFSAITIAVKGNTDRIDDIEKLNFQVSSIYDEIEIDGIKFYLTHGHYLDKYDYLFADNYCLTGHTHRYNLEGKHLNPGSVGLPRYNKEHTFLLYENGEFTLINLDDYSVIAKKTLNK